MESTHHGFGHLFDTFGNYSGHFDRGVKRGKVSSKKLFTLSKIFFFSILFILWALLYFAFWGGLLFFVNNFMCCDFVIEL